MVSAFFVCVLFLFFCWGIRHPGLQAPTAMAANDCAESESCPVGLWPSNVCYTSDCHSNKSTALSLCPCARYVGRTGKLFTLQCSLKQVAAAAIPQAAVLSLHWYWGCTVCLRSPQQQTRGDHTSEAVPFLVLASKGYADTPIYLRLPQPQICSDQTSHAKPLCALALGPYTFQIATAANPQRSHLRGLFHVLALDLYAISLQTATVADLQRSCFTGCSSLRAGSGAVRSFASDCHGSKSTASRLHGLSLCPCVGFWVIHLTEVNHLPCSPIVVRVGFAWKKGIHENKTSKRLSQTDFFYYSLLEWVYCGRLRPK